ncbi:MAG: FAD binding domain-containing protein [Bdellovibrionales bacterium]|nr:FAD binding domain-containing protein [Bdellovibrionales bacterium]
MRNKIIFYLNGKRQEVGADHAGMMFADYLRYEKNLSGTKIVCAEGDCGACSVLRYFPHASGTDTNNYLAINSCITVVANLDGSSLVTVDALKDKTELHQAQKAMVQCHGSQCGFCTPGFVMALTGLVEEKIARKETVVVAQEAKNCMTGNLCRCTGYQPIIDAALSMDLTQAETVKKRFFTDHQRDMLDENFKTGVALESEDFSYAAPKTIKEALDYLAENPDARIVGAATDLGVVHNKRKITLTKLLSLHLIPELYAMDIKNDEVTIGARVTLAEFRHLIKDKCAELAHYLDVFASPQIKNLATVVGNVANASPIGDTPPALLALNASVVINGNKEILLSEFFLAYRKTALKPGEIITGIKFKLPKAEADLKLYKNANRKDLDISSVNLAVHVEWKDKTKKAIQKIIIAVGGVAATPLRLKQTEDFLKTNLDLEAAIKIMHSEFNPLSDVRATAAYRHVLVENFFRRFFADCGGST